MTETDNRVSRALRHANDLIAEPLHAAYRNKEAAERGWQRVEPLVTDEWITQAQAVFDEVWKAWADLNDQRAKGAEDADHP